MRRGAGFYLAFAMVLIFFGSPSCLSDNPYHDKSIAKAIIDRLEARP